MIFMRLSVFLFFIVLYLFFGIVIIILYYIIGKFIVFSYRFIVRCVNVSHLSEHIFFSKN